MILGTTLQGSGTGLHTQNRISFRGNRPRARSHLYHHRADSGQGQSRTKPRIQRGNYPNEKAGTGNHQRNAAAGEIRYRDCLDTGDLCEHSPLPYPPSPGTGRWQTLQKLRQTDFSITGQKGKAVLLGSVPDDLVERPPGTGSEESLLSPHLQLLRKGV